MNIEIEKKFRINDYETAKKEIIDLGAVLISNTHDIDVYFIVPEEKPNTKYLRVRTKKGVSTLAFHEVINDLETKEFETDVADGVMTQTIIKKLGFAEDVVVDKKREKYTLGDAEILVDNVANLGYFVEIEAQSENELDEIASKLSLGDQVVGVGYPDLVKLAMNNAKAS